MNKKTVIALLLGLIVISGVVVIKATKENSPADESRTTLYYGVTCPHCKVVEKWLEENPEIKEKSGLVAKEVYENQENSKELGEKAKECQIGGSGGIGVPFLYDNGQCIIGDQPIIDYLKENYQ